MSVIAQASATKLPFPAIVGHPTVKRALLLLMIEPRLRGVAFAAPTGSAKSTLARSLADLAPDITVNDGCPVNCRPDAPETWCSMCRGRLTPTTVERATRRAPFYTLPLNLTEDRLYGGIDVEAAVTSGSRRFLTGLLAQANRGFLFADNLNLMPSHIENALLECLSEGRLRIEREGLSLEFPANFSLLAAFNPQDGAVRWHVLDRVGLIVAAPRQPELEMRQRVLETVHAFERDGVAAQALYEDEMTALRKLLADARTRLPRVVVPQEFVAAFCRRAIELGVPGHRGELFAALVARANAALDGRLTVAEEDFKMAEFYVLLPRATHIPPPEEQDAEPPPPPEESQDDSDMPPPPPPEELEDLALVFDTEDALLDYDFDFFNKKARLGRYGKRSEQENFRSGRHVRSVPGEITRGRIAVEATLRQAAPHQNVRRVHARERGRSANHVLLTKDDIRIKKYRQKTGALLVFIVDASGSMAVNRMGQAKGAVVELLRQSYVSRDKVAMIGCYGVESKTLLAPTQSVESAKRQLEKLPTGGGTPLNDALRRAHTLIDEVRRSGTYSESMVVILSDGRGNVIARPDAAQPPTTKQEQAAVLHKELEDLARVYAFSQIKTVVIDTQNRFVSSGEAQKLAELLNGKYVYLPKLSAGQIAGVVQKELTR
jgi:magnesium chelatase subunit D